jgi:DNA-binding NarL/FixJ family response regulator
MHVAARINDGKAAVVRATELHPHVAVVGSLQPPETRLQLVRNLRTAVPETKVVVMDFWGNEDGVTEFVQAGAHAFILKDTAANNLLHVIRLAAAGASGRHAPPLIAPAGDAPVRADIPGLSENGFSQLTQREREIALMISQGRSNKEIARELTISLHTVKAPVRGILGKLALRSRVEIAAYAFQGKARSPFVALGLALAHGISSSDMVAEVLIGVQALVGCCIGAALA